MREPQLASPRLHAAFAALGLAFLAIFSWVFFREQGAEWRAAQAGFRRLEATLKNPHQLSQSASAAGLRQIWLPDLGRVDRCTTCHLGTDDPVFGAAPQPFRRMACFGKCLAQRGSDQPGGSGNQHPHPSPPVTDSTHDPVVRSRYAVPSAASSRRGAGNTSGGADSARVGKSDRMAC